MSTSKCVYLDHLIPREPLLYKANVSTGEATVESRNRLTLENLTQDRHLSRQLRKPDFQRATQSWTAEQCVELLESLLQQQVVPSVILWSSPDQFIYVLDGGHRISVLLAWMTDDWGDKDTNALLLREIPQFRETAGQVRRLLQLKHIATYEEHVAADEKYWALEKQFGRNPENFREQMSQNEWNLAEQKRKWRTADVGFPVQWVVGNYDTAERSFLKINKTGTVLTDWETKLVEHRQSSFARLVMSIANPRFAERCWPAYSEQGQALSTQLAGEVQQIVGRAQSISDLLFEPRDALPANTQRPLLVIPANHPELGPAYTAEVMLVSHGMQGQAADLERLMTSDTGGAVGIISTGRERADTIEDALTSLVGPSSRSLSLVASLYFYNPQGSYVRSLFYGLLYWLNYGSEADTRQRKLAFSAYRSAFETVLLNRKAEIIKRISRRIGSGPEVTLQTARYFDGLLRAIVQHQGQTDTESFAQEHKGLLEEFRRTSAQDTQQESQQESSDEGSSSRLFRNGQRIRLQLAAQLEAMPKCPICGGLINPAVNIEIDHHLEHHKGGQTRDDNARIVHPFCNNNRPAIEAIQKRTQEIVLPAFIRTDAEATTLQLTFVDLWENHMESGDDDEVIGDVQTDEQLNASS